MKSYYALCSINCFHWALIWPQLNAAEREVLLRRMEEYCQKQTGMSLHDYAQQLREEPEQQGPVMKL